ncbi:AraC family transcriptional regulator [Alkalihalobacterium bogoriense]|uniref:AraC family transcriptional regulator n=1 Tax=Alkalihalobacterium bogoriense TaxID=246272 RepID=UPI001FDF0526|nr:AraC family transcriptional regulator [Alkalihalobacterium bogoriense]
MIGTKYSINDEEFAIQYVHQSGFVSMPTAHAHPSYELYYVVNGGRVFFINGKIYTAEKGDMIIIFPNDIHRSTSSEKLKCERILINFHDDFISNDMRNFVFDRLSKTSLLHIPINKQAQIEELLENMLRESEEKQAGYEHYVRALLMEVLIELYRHVTKETKRKTESSHPMHQKIIEIAAYVTEHLHEKVTLEDAASRFYISPSYLSRIFKTVTGFHFKEYVQIVRLKEAKRLLRETNWKISYIAEQTGYEHHANFIVAFKRGEGMTPRQYRNINRRTKENS